MTTYMVTGYQRMTIFMRVEADTKAEAMRKARAGEYTGIESEGGPKLLGPRWSVEEGWPHGKY